MSLWTGRFYVNPSGVITFMSDFGLEDGYVGIVKGVILGINPWARIMDITHQIPHGSILDAAFILREAWQFFPQGTVHLAVVDPGVGTSRRPMAIRTGRHFFVGPDNGLFRPIIDQYPSSRMVHLNKKEYFRSEISDTFHGRDIFAPVAAHLSAGLALHLLGPPISNPTSLSMPVPKTGDNLLLGEVIRTDHFGNLITNVDRKTLEKFLGTDKAVIRIGDLRISEIAQTYGDVAPGKVMALIGSAGFLEIAVCLGRAGDLDGLGTKKSLGKVVTIMRGDGAT
jgi:S-adenosyl-L-methionine hydrolase (adenosine-forming)